MTQFVSHIWIKKCVNVNKGNVIQSQTQISPHRYRWPDLPDDLHGVVIFVMVDTHNKHGGIGTWGRDDNPLGTTLQVGLTQRTG